MNKALFTSNKQDWETPTELFKKLNDEFNFTVDVCASQDNAKCIKYYTIKENGLVKSWQNEIVFCNPPYNDIKDWVEKAYLESVGNCTIVLLLPARTDTKWFHDFIYLQAEIRFLKGRLHFSNSKNSAPFPSMIVIFRSRGDRD